MHCAPRAGVPVSFLGDMYMQHSSTGVGDPLRYIYITGVGDPWHLHTDPIGLYATCVSEKMPPPTHPQNPVEDQDDFIFGTFKTGSIAH